MTEQQIEQRLRLHFLNICLAAVAGREGDLRKCKELLVAEVAKMMSERKQHEPT